MATCRNIGEVMVSMKTRVSEVRREVLGERGDAATGRRGERGDGAKGAKGHRVAPSPCHLSLHYVIKFH